MGYKTFNNNLRVGHTLKKVEKIFYNIEIGDLDKELEHLKIWLSESQIGPVSQWKMWCHISAINRERLRVTFSFLFFTHPISFWLNCIVHSGHYHSQPNPRRFLRFPMINYQTEFCRWINPEITGRIKHVSAPKGYKNSHMNSSVWSWNSSLNKSVE